MPRVRIGTRTARGGLDYRTRDERPLTAVLPSAPAAVRVYGPDGCAAALHLDLDASRGAAGAVESDCDRLTKWFARVGARVVVDESPSGGRHIYVPFAERVPYESARELVEALSASHPTLDPGPHRSLLSGCIRPPGAVHKSGGHQVLLTPLATAYDIVRRPNAPAVLERMRVELVDQIAAWRARTAAPAILEGPAQGLGRALHGRLLSIAQSGDYDRTRYGSPSEARQAVIAGAVAAGWSLPDVAVRVKDGRWPGLAAAYARYSPTQRHGALARDWNAAQSFITAQRQAEPAPSDGASPVRRSHTSLPMSQGGCPPAGAGLDDHDHIRRWRTTLRVVELHRLPGRQNHLARFVLRAMGEAAHKTGSRFVSFGTRSLAVAAGAEFSSVAAVLRALARDADGWIDLIEPGRGEHADLYELTIPRDLQQTAADLRWDTGKAYSLRPAFRELGHTAAFVFEAVEAGRASSISELVPATGLARSTAHAAVEVLLAHGLLERAPEGLRARPERLTAVAELVGALDEVRAQLRAYAQQRVQWRNYLTRHDPSSSESERVDAEAWWWPPDDDVGWTLLDTAARAA